MSSQWHWAAQLTKPGDFSLLVGNVPGQVAQISARYIVVRIKDQIGDKPKRNRAIFILSKMFKSFSVYSHKILVVVAML